MSWSPKQQEYFNNAVHRWNVKCGATRSGKTYMDYYVIPKRIRAAAGKDGLVFILGNTKGTLQSNIIEPLQKIWGCSLVSDIKADNTAMLFGEKCHCLGADKISQEDRLRGASIKYCYGDEVVTWHEAVFNMLKSRLDKPYSVFDGTCNPDRASHWFKKFLDREDIDKFVQNYTIDDNPFLSPEFVDNLKKEYAGTVYYDRFILGKWKNADGVIYRRFADDPDSFIIPDDVSGLDIVFATVGVDFGGGKSAHAFNCTAFTRGLRDVITVHDYRRQDAATPEQLYADFIRFIGECRLILPHGVPLVDVYADSAEQTLIGGMRTAAAASALNVNIHNARKSPINDRIRFYTTLMGTGRYKITKHCTSTAEALTEAIWNPKALTADVRLDDGSTNIDNLDAQEYSTEPYMRDILERRV